MWPVVLASCAIAASLWWLVRQRRNVTAALAPHVHYDLVLAVQKSRCGVLDAWFCFFPLLGNEAQYLLLFPYLAWFVDDGCCTLRRAALIGYIALFVANATKDLVQLPRPPRKLHVKDEPNIAQQYGFPSTHSAQALSLSWLLAREASSAGHDPAVTYGLAAFHTCHVCVSRLYLGVHSALDVAGGLAIGGVLVAVFAQCGDAIDAWSAGSMPAGAVGLSIAAMARLYPDRRPSNSAYSETWAFGGLHAGAYLAAGSSLPRRAGPLPPRSACAEMACGLLVLGAFNLFARALTRRLVRAWAHTHAGQLREFLLAAGQPMARAAPVPQHPCLRARHRIPLHARHAPLADPARLPVHLRRRRVLLRLLCVCLRRFLATVRLRVGGGTRGRKSFPQLAPILCAEA